MELRKYQKEARTAILADLEKPGNSLVVMPTASGKSHVIAETANMADQVLILQPSRELLDQNRAKLALLVPWEQIGTYSASFNERTIRKFTFATIQSVYKCPEFFKHVKLVIIDESHGLSPKELESMYTSFLQAIGNPKVIGFTATPYRLEVGYTFDEEGQLNAQTMLKLINRIRTKIIDKETGKKTHGAMFWKRIIYNVSHKTLEDQGYLSPIEYIHEPLLPYASIPINNAYTDYNLEAYTEAIVGMEAHILSTISEAQKRFKSVLVFCSTTDQAQHLSNIIVGSACVLSGTPNKKRAEIIEGFKSGKIKTVFNYGTLTTGFDKPDLESIILLRPTRSLPLYNQMLGRITRISPGKEKGTVIDFTSTCKALGRMETFELYQLRSGVWDLRTEKHPSWNGRVLFSRAIEQKKK